MPSIVVLSSYMHQRGGDLVAAASFIRSLLTQSPDIQIELVIKRDISSHQKDLHQFFLTELGKLSKSVQLTVLNSKDYQQVTFENEQVKQNDRVLSHSELTMLSDENWGYVPFWHGWVDQHALLQSPPLANKFRAAKAIVVVANPHRLIKADYQVLHSYGKPIYTIPEYSLHHTNNTIYYRASGDYRFSTGFEAHELGVYIDEMVKFEGGFEEIEPCDQAFLGHLLGPRNKTTYHASTALFYGYFFDNESLCPPGFTVKIKSFIQNTLLVALSNPEKTQVDLVIPGFADPNVLKKIYEQAIGELPASVLKTFKLVDYHLKNTSNTFDITPVYQSSGTFSLRLINPGRLQRRTIQTLLNEVEPFIGLTGDASWLEGLMKGKITCYQTVNWKQSFYNGFLIYLRSKFLATSPLRQFYEQQGLSRTPPVERWEQMRALYTQHKPQMLQEAQQLAHFIETEKNLNRTMIPELMKKLNIEPRRPLFIEELRAAPAEPQIFDIEPEDSASKRLINIVEELIANIANKTNNRATWFTKDIASKTAKLEAIAAWLRNNPLAKKETVILALIHDVCAIKRNGIGFFSPHSLIEFKQMISNSELKNIEKYHFNLKELKTLESDPQAVSKLINQVKLQQLAI